MQASVLDMDITDESPCESHLGYMLPNINEMVSVEDGYAIDPVHLAMSFGFGEWAHRCANACGAEALAVGPSQYADEGEWLCLVNGSALNQTAVSGFGHVQITGIHHRSDLSMTLHGSTLASAADMSNDLQYVLTWQSVCPMLDSQSGGSSMSQSRSSLVWSGEKVDAFVEQDSCMSDSPASSVVELSLSTIALLQDKYNHLSSSGMRLVSKSTASVSCGLSAPFVGDKGNAMVYKAFTRPRLECAHRMFSYVFFGNVVIDKKKNWLGWARRRLTWNNWIQFKLPLLSKLVK